MLVSELTTFSFPTSIVYGPGSRNQLGDILKEQRIQKPLLVTDPGLVKTEAYTLIEQTLQRQNIDFVLATDVHPNPIEEDIETCGEIFKQNKCDGIIGLGGGSAMDAAKVIAVRVSHEGDIKEYEAQVGGYAKIKGPLAPIITIPTTAGTGSEVGRAGVITSHALGRKVIIFSPLLMPKKAVIDPELTVGLPPHLTAATGMDAFTHNLESLTSPEFHPLCDAIAVGGLELCIRFLERAVRDGGDLEARGNMMIAAIMGAVAFQKDLGAAHSLAHPLSTEFDVHHGLANAICLPATMRFNREAATAHYARVASLFGRPVHAMTGLEAADAAVEEVEALIKRIGITQRLRDFSVPEESLEMLSHKAFDDSCHKTNARPCTQQDLLKLYKEVW